MASRLICCTTLLLVAGCRTPRPPGCEYAHAAQRVRLAAGSNVSDAPATSPVEAELQGPHPLDFYVQIALERNPEIHAAQQIVAAQSEVIPQVTALDDPSLVDTFQPFDDHSVQTAAGRGPNMLTLSQRFPWLAKLRVRGQVAQQGAKIALTRLAQAQLKVIEDVHFAYFELAYSQRAIEITEKNEQLLRDLLKFAQARLRTGASQQDVLRAQLELYRLKNRLIQLRQQYRQAQADLAKLLPMSPEADLQAAIVKLPPAPKQIDRLYEIAGRCRPELQERLHAIVREQRSRELARLQYYPDATLGIGWQTITKNNALSRVANGRDNFAFTVGVTLPIWRDKLRAGVSEAEHRVVASARNYDATRDDTFRLIKRLMVQSGALDEQIKLFRGSIIPKAEQTLRISAADYRVGKVDFQQVIDNWTDLLMFRVQLERLQSSLGQTLASLERVIGCQLASLPQEAAPLQDPPPPAPIPAPKPAPGKADGGPQ